MIFFDATTLAAQLLLALAVDLLIGEYPNSLHPVVWTGMLIGSFDKAIKTRKEGVLLLAGTLFCLTGSVSFLVIGWSFSLLPIFMEIIVGSLLFTSLFSIRKLYTVGKDVAATLEKKDLQEARRLTSWHLVSRDTTTLSESETAAATIESLAENITDSFSSPLFYFLLFGLPGALLFRFVNTCDSMLAYRKPRYEHLGKVSAWFDDILNFLPARLTSLLIVLAAGIIHKTGDSSFRALMQERRNTLSPNAGWTMSAMAGALCVKLEKKGEYILQGGNETINENKIYAALKIVRFSFIAGTIIAFLVLGVVYVC